MTIYGRRETDRKSIIPKFYLLISFFSVLLMAHPAWTQTDDDAEDTEEHIPLLNDSQEQKVVEARENVSQWLTTKAIWFDSFFDDEIYTDEINETSAKAYVSFGYSKEDGFDFQPRMRIHLRLPHMEDKVRLALSFTDDSDFEYEEDTIETSTTNEERGEATASLSYFLREKAHENLSLSAGGSWDYLYAGVRYRYSKTFSLFKSRFVNTLRYYTDDGWEDRVSLEISRSISEKVLLRNVLSGKWLEEKNGFAHSLALRLYQNLSSNRALRYETTGYMETSPEYYLRDLKMAVTYRQKLYKDWLFLETTPFLAFPKEDYDADRKTNPGISFKLEVYFGHEIGSAAVFN